MKKVIKKSSVKKMQMGGSTKSPKGINKYSSEEFAAKEFRNLDGSDYSKNPNRTVTQTSGDNKYVIKDKYNDGIRTSSKERRTVKGFLTGAPRAAGKTPLDKKGNVMKKGGVVKAKNGKSFPDLNKDGKITKADILKGRGVIAKKGKTIKKAQLGGLLDKVVGGLGKSAGGFSKIKDMFGNSGFGNAGLGMINSLRKKKQASAQAPAPAMKKGGKVAKKMQYGGAAASMVPPMMKKGGATKKCKYGCK
jgi:hypothetical protein